MKCPINNVCTMYKKLILWGNNDLTHRFLLYSSFTTKKKEVTTQTTDEDDQGVEKVVFIWILFVLWEKRDE